MRLRLGRLLSTLCHVSKELLSNASVSANDFHGKVWHIPPGMRKPTIRSGNRGSCRQARCSQIAGAIDARTILEWIDATKDQKDLDTSSSAKHALSRISRKHSRMSAEDLTASVRAVGRATLTRARPRLDTVCMLLFREWISRSTCICSVTARLKGNAVSCMRVRWPLDSGAFLVVLHLPSLFFLVLPSSMLFSPHPLFGCWRKHPKAKAKHSTRGKRSTTKRRRKKAAPPNAGGSSTTQGRKTVPLPGQQHQRMEEGRETAPPQKKEEGKAPPPEWKRPTAAPAKELWVVLPSPALCRRCSFPATSPPSPATFQVVPLSPFLLWRGGEVPPWVVRLYLPSLECVAFSPSYLGVCRFPPLFLFFRWCYFFPSFFWVPVALLSPLFGLCYICWRREEEKHHHPNGGGVERRSTTQRWRKAAPPSGERERGGEISTVQKSDGNVAAEREQGRKAPAPKGKREESTTAQQEVGESSTPEEARRKRSGRQRFPPSPHPHSSQKRRGRNAALFFWGWCCFPLLLRSALLVLILLRCGPAFFSSSSRVALPFPSSFGAVLLFPLSSEDVFRLFFLRRGAAFLRAACFPRGGTAFPLRW